MGAVILWWELVRGRWGCCELEMLRMGCLFILSEASAPLEWGCRLQVICSPLAFSRQGGVIFLPVSWLGSNLGDYILPA